MILDKKHAMQQKLFRQFAETEFTKELQDELDNTGEFNWEMHKKMSKYGFMGVKIDPELNGKRGKEMMISTPDSKVQVWVVPTNEELMIAQDTAELVNAAK